MCQISWINDKGEFTPDDNAPIGRVRCKQYGYVPGIKLVRKPWEGAYSQWFTICEEHAKHLSAPDMQDWEFEALPA